MRLIVDVRHNQGDFSINVNTVIESDACGLFGRSGSGKSSLLRIIAGLERPDMAFIKLDDEVLVNSNKKKFVPPYKRHIGWVSQSALLFPHLSVEQNIHSGIRPKNIKFPYTEKEIVELLEITPLMSRSVHHLSGGEQHRVSMARTLLSYPRLLLFDEPLAAFDNHLKENTLPFLNTIRSELGIPFIYVSHDFSEILQLTNQMILLEAGKVIKHGSVSQLIEHPEMLQLIHDRDLNQLITHQLCDEITVPFTIA